MPQADLTLEYTGDKSVTIKSYKNMTLAYFKQQTAGTTFTLKNLILDGSNPSFAGAVLQREESVCMLEAGTMVLENTQIYGSSINADGGAVLVADGTLQLKGTTELSNNNGANGGAIAQTGGSIVVSGEAKIVGNTAVMDGGAIYSVAGSVVFSETASLEENIAGTAGGGIYFTGETLNLLENASLKKNKAGGNGGAVFFEGNHLTIKSGVTVSGNSGGNGGGLYLAAGEDASVTIGGSYEENKGSNGAGIYIKEGNIAVAGTLLLDGNEATQNGGGICLKEGSFSGSMYIQNNTAMEKGAAIYVAEDSVCSLNGGSICNNGRDASSVEIDLQKKTSNDIYIAGVLEILGVTVIQDAIYLSGTAEPIRIKGSNAGTQGAIIGYHSVFEGNVLVQYDTETAAESGIHYLIEKDYQDETDDAKKRPNLSVDGTNVRVALNHVYLKTIWTTAELDEAQEEGKITASGFEEACEKLSQLGKGNLIICGQVLIDSEETWDFSGKGLSWKPEIRFSEDCLEECNKVCTVTCSRACSLFFHSIYVSDTGKLVLDSVTINGNEVGTTGLIYVKGGELCIQGDTTIKSSGKRAIYIESGACHMTSGEIRECLGGGIYNKGTLTITPGNGEAVFIEQNEFTADDIVTGGVGIYNAGTCNLITEGTGEIGLSHNTLYPVNRFGNGGAAIRNSGTLHIETDSEKGKISFEGNMCNIRGSSCQGGGAILNWGGSATIDGRDHEGEKTIVFRKNQVNGTVPNDSGGGAIKNDSSGQLKVQHAKFERNVVDGTGGISGGALESYKGQVEISYCLFFYNECRTIEGSGRKGHGGALLNVNGSMQLKGCHFKGNQSQAAGGAVWYQKYNAPKRIENCVFEDNTTKSGSGGGLCISGGDAEEYLPVLENCEFRNNTAPNGVGGGLYGTVKEVRNSSFINNIAKSNGGGVYTEADIFLDHVEFSGNSSTGGSGGGIFSNINGNLTITIQNCNFKLNVAKTHGGGAAARNIIAKSSIFEKNTAAGNEGGGIYCQGTATIEDSKFISNEAKTNGGGASLVTAFIENTEFRGNVAYGMGGGARVTKSARLEGCSFLNNRLETTTVSNGGGAVCLAGEEAWIVNCRMKNNTSTRRGGAILNTSKNCVVLDSSIIENVAPMGAINNSGTMELENCDISQNTSDATFDYAAGLQNSGSCTIKNCRVNANVVESINDKTAGAAGISNSGTLYMEDSQLTENVVNGNVKFVCAIINMSGNFTIVNSNCTNNDGNGLYVYNGTVYIQGDCVFRQNKATGLWLQQGNLYMNDGTSSENQTYGLYVNQGVATLNGGTIRGNMEKDVYVNAGQLKLSAGNVQVAGNIYLHNANKPLGIHDARASATNQYNIELSNAFNKGYVIVTPFDNLNDAGLYQHFFQILRSGTGLEASGGKLLLSQVYFVGETGKEVVDTDTLGATPRNPFTSWEELKVAIGNTPATIYVCGTIEISGDTTGASKNPWSLAANQNVYRYTGGAIAGTDYSQYAFLNGPLFRVKEGGTAKFENVSIYGNKFLEQEVNSQEGSSLVAVEPGGELILGKNCVIGSEAEQGHTGYDSAVIQNGGTLTLTYNAKIRGALALNEYTDDDGNVQMSYVKADSTFEESLTLKLSSWKEGQLCVDYGDSEISPEQAAKVTAQYEVDGQICSLVLNMIDSESKRIEVAKKGIFYVDGTRDASLWAEEDGTTPQTAFHSMEQVYHAIKETITGPVSIQYVVYIVGMVELDGRVGYYSNQAYGTNEDNLAVMLSNTILVKRYSRPFRHPDWKSSYEGALFHVTGDVILHNLIFDGHSMPETVMEEDMLVVEQEAVETAGPLFLTDAGSRLSLTGVTNLRNNGGNVVDAAGNLYLAGNARLTGKVTVTGDTNRIYAETAYLPADALTVVLESGEDGRVLVEYEDTQEPSQTVQDTRLKQYVLDGEAKAEYRFVTEDTTKKQIALKKKGAIYLDPVNGNDANVNNCETPETAVKTLEKAYQAAVGRVGGCNVFVVNSVEITESTMLSATIYECNGKKITLSNSSVNFYRYIAERTQNAGDTQGVGTAGLSGYMFVVGNQSKYATLTIENLVIDGNKARTDQSAEAVETKAMILVQENAGLVVKNGAVLQNNRSSFVWSSAEAEAGNVLELAPEKQNVTDLETAVKPGSVEGMKAQNTPVLESAEEIQIIDQENYAGGAIYNLGTVSLKGGTIMGNETTLVHKESQEPTRSYPAAMMQGGTLELESGVVLSQQEIFLGEGRHLQVKEYLRKTDFLVLRMENYSNKRQVAVFEDAACETGEDGELTVTQEMLVKLVLPVEMSREVVITRSENNRQVAVLKRLVSLMKEPADILGPLTQPSEVRTTWIELTEATNMEDMRTELWYQKETDRKRVVFAQSGNPEEKYISGGFITMDVSRARYRVGIPVEQDTVGTYEFAIYLEENLVARAGFTVSAYVWTDVEGNPAEKITVETRRETGKLQETPTCLVVYSGYDREMKGWIDGASMEGINGYEPYVVPESQMNRIPVTEGSTAFAVRMEEKETKSEVLTIPAFGSGVMDITFISHWALNREEAAMAYLEGIFLGEVNGEQRVKKANTALMVETKTQQTKITIKLDDEVVTQAGILFQREEFGELEFYGNYQEEDTSEENSSGSTVEHAAAGTDGNNVENGNGNGNGNAAENTAAHTDGEEVENADQNAQVYTYTGTVPAGNYTLVFQFGGGTGTKNVTIENGQNNELWLDFCTVTFEKGAKDAVSGTGEKVVLVEQGEALLLPDEKQNLFTWSGYRVSGWKEQGNEGATLPAGSEVTITGPTVFEAVWKMVPIPVITSPPPTPTTVPGEVLETVKPLQTPNVSMETEKPMQTPVMSEETVKPAQTPITGEETVKPMQTPATSEETQKPVQTPVGSGETAKPVQTPVTSGETQKPEQTPGVSTETMKPEKTPEGGIVTPKPTVHPAVTKTPVRRPTPTVPVTAAPLGTSTPQVPEKTPASPEDWLKPSHIPGKGPHMEKEESKPEITKGPKATPEAGQENIQTKPEETTPTMPPEQVQGSLDPQKPGHGQQEWGIEENSSRILVYLWDWLLLLALSVATRQYCERKFGKRKQSSKQT